MESARAGCAEVMADVFAGGYVRGRSKPRPYERMKIRQVRAKNLDGVAYGARGLGGAFAVEALGYPVGGFLAGGYGA